MLGNILFQILMFVIIWDIYLRIGGQNLTGLADALLDSIPVVAITGQVSAPFIGTDAFQEVDVLGLSLACLLYTSRLIHFIQHVNFQ